jgi:rhodanese-related sulfurtransferase
MTTSQHELAASDTDDAVRHFARKLRFETDPSDVNAAIATGAPGFVLVDSRGPAAWAQGHIPGATHLPTRDIPSRADELLDRAMPVVTYCWGPGCNGSTRAARALAELGYSVKEMIGGFEYWAREGLLIESTAGQFHRPVDELTSPRRPEIDCEC